VGVSIRNDRLVDNLRTNVSTSMNWVWWCSTVVVGGHLYLVLYLKSCLVEKKVHADPLHFLSISNILIILDKQVTNEQMCEKTALSHTSEIYLYY